MTLESSAERFRRNSRNWHRTWKWGLQLFRISSAGTWNHGLTGAQLAWILIPFLAAAGRRLNVGMAQGLWNPSGISQRTTPPYHRVILESEQVEQARTSKEPGTRTEAQSHTKP